MTTTADILGQRADEAAAAAHQRHATTEARDAARAAAAADAAKREREAANRTHGPHYWPSVRNAAISEPATEQDADNLAATLAALEIPTAAFLADVEHLRAYLIARAALEMPVASRARLEAGLSDGVEISRQLGRAAKALRQRGCVFLRIIDGGPVADLNPARHPVEPLPERADALFADPRPPRPVQMAEIMFSPFQGERDPSRGPIQKPGEVLPKGVEVEV